jgi:hypothetical protein
VFNFKSTSKGHILGQFKDRFGADCTIQESSYPDEACLWLGVEVDSGGDAVPNGRMHLNQAQAQELIEVLRYFVNEGGLGRYTPEDFHVGRWVRGVDKGNLEVVGRIVEVRPMTSIVIQDRSVPGPQGQHVCLWNEVPRRWVPEEAPPEGRSIFDLLNDD